MVLVLVPSPPVQACRKCRHWKRCKSLIGDLTGDETQCDFAPSRFVAAGGGVADDTPDLVVAALAEATWARAPKDVAIRSGDGRVIVDRRTATDEEFAAILRVPVLVRVLAQIAQMSECTTSRSAALVALRFDIGCGTGHRPEALRPGGIQRCLADDVAELHHLARMLVDVNTRIAERLARGEGTATPEERNQLGYELGLFSGRIIERGNLLRPRLEALLMDGKEVPRD